MNDSDHVPTPTPTWKKWITGSVHNPYRSITFGLSMILKKIRERVHPAGEGQRRYIEAKKIKHEFAPKNEETSSRCEFITPLWHAGLIRSAIGTVFNLGSR